MYDRMKSHGGLHSRIVPKHRIQGAIIQQRGSWLQVVHYVWFALVHLQATVMLSALSLCLHSFQPLTGAGRLSLLLKIQSTSSSNSAPGSSKAKCHAALISDNGQPKIARWKNATLATTHFRYLTPFPRIPLAGTNPRLPEDLQIPSYYSV